MAIILNSKEIPVCENRTRSLTVDAPPSVSPLEWDIVFRRQFVTSVNNVIKIELESDPIAIKVSDIYSKVFTRQDGSTFTGAQAVNDVKLIGDALFLERNPQND